MKSIQPIQVWKNGEEKQANTFNLILINDDLATSATFYYQLIASSSDEEGNVSTEQLADGNVGMGGDDYSNWDGSNDAAYNYVAGKLNLTIIS